MTVKSILFVDDEVPLLNSLKRMLKPLEHDWQLTFAGGASEALIMMEQAPVDVVVADLCMPQMDGIELLSLVKEKYPHVVRVMLTGQPEYENYRNSMTVSQYFLWKPVKLSAMETLLQLLSNQEVCLEATY
ncbi:MAG: response regulator [Thermodesulfobacteriota bacterium]|nr:response regulator [Thermodesulfobacteriota bacterium]